jgi:hypothetical protein
LIPRRSFRAGPIAVVLIARRTPVPLQRTRAHPRKALRVAARSHGRDGDRAAPGGSPALGRTLRSTNSIESMISVARTHSRNVKNWQNGQMALRWCAARIAEAGKQFRVNGHLYLAALRRALDEHVAAELSAPSVMMNP